MYNSSAGTSRAEQRGLSEALGEIDEASQRQEPGRERAALRAAGDVMAIQHLSTNLCDYLITANDGRLSLIGTFANIQARTFPALKDPMGVVVEFRGDVGDQFSLSIEGPDGIISLGEGVVEVPSGLVEFQQWASSAAMQARPAIFRQPGVYAIVLRSGTDEIHRHPFGVFQIPSGEEPSNA